MPQGCILGPLLFILYVNVLLYTIPDKCVLYADDISIIKTSTKDINKTEINIDNSIKLTIKWLSDNNLHVEKKKLYSFQLL